MRALVFFLIVTTVWMGNRQSAFAAITYVDSTTANTTLNGANLSEGVNFTTSASDGAMDHLWHLRSGVSNGNSVWTADESNSGTEDVAPLITTISFPEAGAYRLFIYIWNSSEPGADWDVRVRLGNEGVFSKIQASEAESAESARFNSAIVVEENSRTLIQIPLGVVVVTASGSVQIHIDDDSTTDSRRTWYDGVGYEKVFSNLGERIIAIDFNKTNLPGAPSQAMFRSIGGSSTTSQNSTNIVKQVGDCSVQLTKASSLAFDFRGANRVSTHTVPGGPTSLAFLVSDFIGARDGTINLKVSNLPTGTYLFRSYHLDPFNSINFGYAQGTNSTTQNTLRAVVAGNLQAIVQPTVLGSLGLNTSFITDADIPQLSFPFVADGTNAVQINLSTIYTNGTDRFIFMNGFEIFSTTP